MFKNLTIWKDSIIIIKKIYNLANLLPNSEEYNLKSQLRRAVVSVSLNIAEGKCRATSKEFAKFLNNASASLYEVDAIIVICEELKYISCDTNIHNQINVLNKKINSLRNKLLVNGD